MKHMTDAVWPDGYPDPSLHPSPHLEQSRSSEASIDAGVMLVLLKLLIGIYTQLSQKVLKLQ